MNYLKAKQLDCSADDIQMKLPFSQWFLSQQGPRSFHLSGESYRPGCCQGKTDNNRQRVLSSRSEQPHIFTPKWPNDRVKGPLSALL